MILLYISKTEIFFVWILILLIFFLCVNGFCFFIIKWFAFWHNQMSHLNRYIWSIDSKNCVFRRFRMKCSSRANSHGYWRKKKYFHVISVYYRLKESAPHLSRRRSECRDSLLETNNYHSRVCNQIRSNFAGA